MHAGESGRFTKCILAYLSHTLESYRQVFCLFLNNILFTLDACIVKGELKVL